jgi:acetylornithine deacetylase/succinyl-diaminopimelate desuccinylase-like protein
VFHEQELRDEATDLLRALLRIDTSNPPGGETPAALLLRDYLESNGVACELVARDPGRANLIARIPGDGSGPSLTLLGHTDVVPADAAAWTHPPFSGHLDADGYVWGRGAVDMKNETATRAVAMAALARSGFRPRGDLVYLAVADEEDGSEEVGLTWLVGERPDIATDYALNEGGSERFELADGRVVVTVQIGEKRTLPCRVWALGTPGHASVPAGAPRAVPRLATLIERVAAYRPERRLLPATRGLLESLGISPDDDLDAALAEVEALHPGLAPLVVPLFSTTIAPTRLSASSALNVMPARASVDLDCRVLPDSGEAELRAELIAALGADVPYELDFWEAPNGGSISEVETPLFDVCRRFVEAADPGAIVVPTISTGFTDSHFLRAAFGTVAYGFWPCRTTPLDVVNAGMHGHDERVHVDDLGYATRFHVEAAQAIGRLDRSPAR